MVALEGTRSYGVGLARAMQTAGLTVVEIERPRRGERRRGKLDPIDACLAVLYALRLDADRLPIPRADGDREVLRILLGARRELTTTTTRAINRLRALLLTGSDDDRALSRSALTQARLAAIARRRGSRHQTREQAIRRGEARRLALAIREVDRQLASNKHQLADLVAHLAPQLLARRGMDPVSAAQAIVSWSHPGRCRDDAAYAALAGASPIPASSGRVVRHRLHRGGDRDLHRAVHDILLTRWRLCPCTRAYVTRRRAEGKSDAEIRRCLKRYIARELYRCLNAAMTA
ncbi:transposase [Carbonactinospora thermoautotrophica]|uniref:transposase n=1 Tax=Carbonactinospora thermoautotrophica TaxID=1469144 RepID=UPI0022715C74|nr:transposase [Carbonactinospora thermoautotrophica]